MKEIVIIGCDSKHQLIFPTSRLIFVIFVTFVIFVILVVLIIIIKILLIVPRFALLLAHFRTLCPIRPFLLSHFLWKISQIFIFSFFFIIYQPQQSSIKAEQYSISISSHELHESLHLHKY